MPASQNCIEIIDVDAEEFAIPGTPLAQIENTQTLKVKVKSQDEKIKALHKELDTLRRGVKRQAPEDDAPSSDALSGTTVAPRFNLTLSQMTPQGRIDSSLSVRIKGNDEDGIFDFTGVEWPDVPVPKWYKYHTFHRQDICETLGARSDHDLAHVKYNYARHYPLDPVSQISRKPFAIFNNVLSPDGPPEPGMHGCVFIGGLENLRDGSPVNQIEVFMRRGPSKRRGWWQYCGTYSVGWIGELSRKDISILPQETKNRWAEALAARKWGEDIVNAANVALASKCKATRSPVRQVDRNPEAIMIALHNGDITLHFSVLKCIGFSQLVYDSLCPGPTRNDPKPTTAIIKISVEISDHEQDILDIQDVIATQEIEDLRQREMASRVTKRRKVETTFS